jgi:hypothetical protein
LQLQLVGKNDDFLDCHGPVFLNRILCGVLGKWNASSRLSSVSNHFPRFHQ